MAEADEEPAAPPDDTDVSRYGMVRLTPLGLYGLRARLLEAGFTAPAVGDLADKGADALLDGTSDLPRRRPRRPRPSSGSPGANPSPRHGSCSPRPAARTPGAPLRRLRCQQALSLVGAEAEPALREVLDDAGARRTGPGLAGRARGARTCRRRPQDDDLLADRRHDRRAAGRRGQLRGAAGPGRGAGRAAQRVLRRPPGGSTTRPPRTCWRRWGGCTRTRRSRRRPARPPSRRARSKAADRGGPTGRGRPGAAVRGRPRGRP